MGEGDNRRSEILSAFAKEPVTRMRRFKLPNGGWEDRPVTPDEEKAIIAAEAAAKAERKSGKK
jgi:hypothetical protein